MLDYTKFKHNELTEKLVDIISSKVSTHNTSFFRVHVNYYMTMLASSMRASYYEPGEHTITRPINMYAINLAPSGFGKGYATSIMEDQVIHKFREKFLNETWPIITTHNLAKTADFRARNDVKDPEETLMRVQKEFERMGSYEFTFDKPTEPAVKQMRSMLLLAGLGSINLQVDEIGANLFKTKDAFPAFLELYDGKLKNNLTKNTSESVRAVSVYGITPANIMFFGVPSSLLDNGKNEDEFQEMNAQGFARRSIYAYISDEEYTRKLELKTAAEQLAIAKQADSSTVLDTVADDLEALADPLQVNVKLPIPDDTALLYFSYKNDCKTRAIDLPAPEVIQRTEMEHRHTKAIKIAGTYAFIESAPQIEVAHLESAIAFVEESGEAFKRIMHRDMPHVKLAKHLGMVNQELTKVSLREQLPFFKGGTKQSRDEMLAEAIEWGYTNNIAIKRRYSSGIEFYSGQYLESNDLTKLKISFSNELAYNYTSQEIPWDKMDKLANVSDIHWINHTLENGFDHKGHRHNDNCIPGFNMVVLDVDKGMTIQTATRLLEGYKAFYYVTKRHTAAQHRFRIILPINYTLELDADDFEGFMSNLYEWLPFDSDEATGQRSRKWLTNDGHSMFTDGKLLDALPFIPRTNKQIEFSERLVDLGNLGGIERWFILNTVAGENRNNNMLRYGLMLIDGGMDVIGARDKIMALNAQLIKPMAESRIDQTIMKTVSKHVQARAI